MQILVVDDEQPIMQLCVKVLEDQGHTVDGFTRGEQILGRLGTQPTDLLVVDYKMPGLNGVEVVRRSRALRPGVRVLMITGHGTQDVLDEAQAVGVNGILLKPFTPNELVEAVGVALGVPPSPTLSRPA
jgi:two-component system, NtrC family, response regulator AtoC